MNKIETVYTLGQSLWYDNIERRLLENGELAAMIARGEIKGMTSNPTIFHNAIAKSQDYDEELTSLVKAGFNTKEIFEKLAIRDICQAANLLLPLYEATSH